MNIECDNMDFTTFNCDQLISRQLVIEIMAKELRDKNDDDKSAMHRARVFLAYRVEKNQLALQSDSFVSGRLAHVLRNRFPDKFIGWKQIDDEIINERFDLGGSVHAVEIPSEVARKDEMIMRLSSALLATETELDRDSPDAEKWRQEKIQRSVDGKKGGRPFKND